MYILDTHTLLWFLDESENLSQNVRNIIASADDLFVSIATFWEIAIKQNLGKLKIDFSPSELEALAKSQSIQVLPVTTEYLDIIKNLERIHRDPFDRMIIATAMVNNFTILTCDGIIPNYKVKTAW